MRWIGPICIIIIYVVNVFYTEKRGHQVRNRIKKYQHRHNKYLTSYALVFGNGCMTK